MTKYEVRRTTVIRVALAFFVLGLGTACGDSDFEYQQLLSYNAQMGIQGLEGEPGTPSATDQTGVLTYHVDFELMEMSPELVEYAEEDKFKELHINRVGYTVTGNALTIDLDGIDVAFGPMGLEDSDSADAVLVATVPAIEAGAKPADIAVIHDENSKAARKHVFVLDFGIAQGAKVPVLRGDLIPSGSITLEMELAMTLIADPLD